MAFVRDTGTGVLTVASVAVTTGSDYLAINLTGGHLRVTLTHSVATQPQYEFTLESGEIAPVRYSAAGNVVCVGRASHTSVRSAQAAARYEKVDNDGNLIPTGATTDYLVFQAVA